MPPPEQQVVSTGYTPRPLQAEIHKNLKRFNVLVCHRRFGKTVLAINELIDQALRCKLPRPRYAYIAPLYRQAKQIAWDYLRAYTEPIPGVSKNEAELRVDLPTGGRIQLLGAENCDSLRGIYLDGAVLDEYGQITPRAWSEVLRPALADRKGWAIFIGTPKGRNSFWKMYHGATEGWESESGELVKDPAWWGKKFPQSETGILDAGEIEAMRREMEPAEFEQELECSFLAAIAGAYFASLIGDLERAGHIGEVPWKSNLQVTTAWDLGVGDDTTIWFVQQDHDIVRVIDYYSGSGVGLDHYVKVLREKPYTYAGHILPHDAAAHDLTTGQTRVSFMHGLGLSRIKVLPKADIDSGIHAVRQLLPRCRFDKEACRKGIEHLIHYRRDWDEKNGVFRLRPKHDEHSHAADAFRYLASGLGPPPNEVKRPRFAKMAYNELRGTSRERRPDGRRRFAKM